MSNLDITIVDTKDYGPLEFLTKSAVRIGQLLIFSYLDENKRLIAGVSSPGGKEIIPFAPTKSIFYNKTEDDKDIALNITKGNNQIECYHVKYNAKNKPTVQHFTNPTGNIEIIDVDKEQYWLIKRTNKIETESAVYDINKATIITPYFSKIQFLESNEYGHLAAAYKHIYHTDELGGQEKITTLVTYIDYDGNFNSEILDTQRLVHYNPSSTEDSNVHYFNSLVEEITQNYLDKIEAIKSQVDILFTTPLPNKKDQPHSQTNAEIISFPQR